MVVEHLLWAEVGGLVVHSIVSQRRDAIQRFRSNLPGAFSSVTH